MDHSPTRCTFLRPCWRKSVYISFGKVDAKLADNYFDLLPGQAVDVTISSAASLDDLKAQMRVISLTDVFAPHEAGAVIERDR